MSNCSAGTANIGAIRDDNGAGEGGVEVIHRASALTDEISAVGHRGGGEVDHGRGRRRGEGDQWRGAAAREARAGVVCEQEDVSWVRERDVLHRWDAGVVAESGGVPAR